MPPTPPRTSDTPGLLPRSATVAPATSAARTPSSASTRRQGTPRDRVPYLSAATPAQEPAPHTAAGSGAPDTWGTAAACGPAAGPGSCGASRPGRMTGRSSSTPRRTTRGASCNRGTAAGVAAPRERRTSPPRSRTRRTRRVEARGRDGVGRRPAVAAPRRRSPDRATGRSAPPLRPPPHPSPAPKGPSRRSVAAPRPAAPGPRCGRAPGSCGAQHAPPSGGKVVVDAARRGLAGT